MICKELDPSPKSTNKFSAAGRAAEEQLAFYLRRAFDRDYGVRVFNGLRFERDGDAAQLDHLLLHRLGLIIVESKSVIGEVSLNEHQEWIRTFGGQSVGMPSPVLQGRRQGEFLRRYLEDVLMMRGTPQSFGWLRIDVVVAICDRGIVRRPPGLELAEICKADQVPERVHEIIRRTWQARNPSQGTSGYAVGADFTFVGPAPGTAPRDISWEAMDWLTTFLLRQHKPLDGRWSAPSQASIPPSQAGPSAMGPIPGGGGVGGSSPRHGRSLSDIGLTSLMSNLVSSRTPLPVERPAFVGPRCKACGCSLGLVLHGRYGYYFKCSPCGANTNINVSCPACRGSTRLRKQGSTFTLECTACAFTVPYHVNPP